MYMYAIQRAFIERQGEPAREQTGEELFGSLLQKPSRLTPPQVKTAPAPRLRRFILCGCLDVKCPASHWEDEPAGNPYERRTSGFPMRPGETAGVDCEGSPIDPLTIHWPYQRRYRLLF